MMLPFLFAVWCLGHSLSRHEAHHLGDASMSYRWCLCFHLIMLAENNNMGKSWKQTNLFCGRLGSKDTENTTNHKLLSCLNAAFWPGLLISSDTHHHCDTENNLIYFLTEQLRPRYTWTREKPEHFLRAQSNLKDFERCPISQSCYTTSIAFSVQDPINSSDQLHIHAPMVETVKHSEYHASES